MIDYNLELRDGWTLNSVYDKIYNCAIVKAPFDKETVSSQRIMLDKRLWLSEDFWKTDYKYTDTIKVDWRKYYYGIDTVNNKGFISNENWLHIYEVPVDENSPLRVARGIWAGWQLIINWTSNTTDLAPATTTTVPAWAPEELKVFNDSELWNSSWFVTLNISWATTGQYITFTSGLLKGTVNKILYAEANKIYISGTNIRWTLPEAQQKYYIFSESRETIVIGATDWLHVVSITDRDDSAQNKYILNLAASSVSHWSINIDGTTVVFDSNDPTQAKAAFDAAMGTTVYDSAIVDGLLQVNKTNGSIMTFSDIYTWVLIDSQMIWGNNYSAKWFGWFSMTLDGNDIISYAKANDDNTADNTSFVTWRYRNISDEDKSITYQSFQKDTMLNDINSKIPAWYTWTIVTVAWDSTVSSTYGWTTVTTYQANKRLFIKKNDNTAVTANTNEFYYTYISAEDNNQFINWYTWVTLNIDWTPFTVNVTDELYSHNIMDTLRNLVAADSNFRVTTREYDSNRGTWGFMVSALDGRSIPVSFSYSWTSLWARVGISTYSTTKGSDVFTKADEYSWAYSAVNINAVNAYWIRTIVDDPITDVVNFNWAIFSMSQSQIYFSRITFDDNTSFYPLDRFAYKWWIKLLPFGKILLAMWANNQIITTATTELNWVKNVVTYRKNDLEYNGEIFSRYSYIFTEGTMYVLQADKTLVQLTVTPTDSLTYTVNTQELSRNYRWLFENATGECFANRYWNQLHFLVVNWGTTQNFKYDLSMQAWTIDKYNTEIYRIWEKALTGWARWRVASLSWYTDFWEDYSQEINFNIGSLIKFSMGRIIRTAFGLTHESITDLTLDVEYEIWGWEVIKQKREIENFSFDANRTLTPDEDDLIEEDFDVYEWTVVTVQNDLTMSWKFIRFKYSGVTRFILWDSYIISSESKPYINNIWTSI